MSEFISAAEAAPLLGIKKRRVLVLIETGRLPATRIGNAWVIRPADLALVADRPKGRPRKTAPLTPAA